MQISLVIITFNEADRLPAALESCLEIADEMIVVDSHSTDQTVPIARRFGAKVFQKDFTDYGSQKNHANQLAGFNWILNLDADERLSRQLVEEIKKLKQQQDTDCSGYHFNRRTSYLGRWIRFSGWYPDRKLRLFRKDRSRWQGRIHEKMVISGPTGHLPGDLIHYTYRNMSDHLQRLNRYSTMQAEDLASSSKRLLLLKGFLLPPITFVRFYIWKMGILDGFPGFIIALFSSWATAMKYLKAYAINRRN